MSHIPSQYVEMDGDKPLIRYDKMSPDNKPPRWTKIAVCPNCKLVGKVIRGEKSDTYVHTAWQNKRDETPRHRCKLSHDGMDVEIVMPVMPAKEEPCTST